MALAIDGSSPAVFTSTSGTATSASFTPPANSFLLVVFSGNSTGGANPSAPTITDNLGAHLTYTRKVWRSRADGSPTVDGHVAIWTAPVATSAAMTVSVTQSISELGCRIWVLTGHDPVTPIGAFGGAGSASANSIAQNYTAQATSGQGFGVVCDWSALGAETAGTGCTMDGSGNVGSGQISYGFIRRTTADDSNGGTNTLNVTIPGTSTSLQWGWVEILPLAPPPTEVPGQPVQNIPSWLLYLLAQRALRQNTASAVAALTQTVDQVIETDTAQAIMVKKTTAIGQVTETDTAQAISHAKKLILSQVTETDTAQAITAKKTKTVGQVIETDTAQIVAWKHQRLVNQVTETDTAQAIAHSKLRAIGQVTETDTAQALAHAKRATLGQPVETDTAQTVTPRKTKAVGQVTETDTAQAIDRKKLKLIGQVLETETAQTVTWKIQRLITQVTETDSAQSISSHGTKVISVGQVTENETAQAITVRKAKVVVQAIETDTAQTVTPKKTRTIVQVLETDTSQAITHRKALSLGQAIETDAAQTITRKQISVVGQVTETDTAQTIIHRKAKVVVQALETDTAGAVTAKIRRLVGQVLETEVAALVVRFGSAPVAQTNKHRVYLLLKTVAGNTAYVKRRSATITGIALDGNPILRVRHTGEVYGNASVGVPPRTDPDANVTAVYVTY